MASANTFSLLLLLLSLFSLITATFIVPTDVNVILPHQSCKGTPGHKKCTGSNTAEISATYKLITLIDIARQSISAAKEAGVNVMHFMSNIVGHPSNNPAVAKCMSTCSVTINAAVKELNKCVMLMNGKTTLSEVELRTIKKSVNIASKSAVKCNVNCKQSNANMQVMFESLLGQFIKISNNAVTVTSKITVAT